MKNSPDPSRTGLLRRSLAARVGRAVDLVLKDIRRLLVDDDALGAAPLHVVLNAGEWRLLPPAEKSRAFAAWLRTVLPARFRSAGDDAVYKAYLERAYSKGVSRSVGDARRGKPADPTPGPDDPQLVKLILGGPASRESIDALVQRAYADVKGLTDDMEVRLVRTLADGLAAGKNPKAMVSDLSEALDIPRARAKTIARTEVVRAHAEGQLRALEAMGVTELGVSVEWVTGGKPCPKCAAMAGTVSTVAEARGKIPHHPNCRCAWVPYIKGVK